MKRTFLILLLAIAGCSNEPQCSSKVIDRTFDTESDRYAATEVRDCGATTDYATVVRIGRTSENSEDAEEVFVADADHGRARFGADRSIWISVGWTAPGKLTVSYASQARVFKKLTSAKRAEINYRATDSLEPPLSYGIP